MAAFVAGRVLVVGDALGTARVLPRSRRAARGAPAPAARSRRARCGGLAPEHVLCGHGEGVHGGDAAAALDEALRHGAPPDPALAAGVDPGVAEPMRTLVFIPAWNEAENLPAVLEELHGELPDVDVLVVDDGSTDGTAELAREAGAEVLSFGQNRGLRAAIAAGYGYAAEHGLRARRALDADGQHPAAELRRLLEPASRPARPTRQSARASSPARATSPTATGRAASARSEPRSCAG